MTKTWREELRNAIDQNITNVLPDATRAQEGGAYYWYTYRDKVRHSVALEFGKHTSVPQFRIAFYTTSQEDKYAITSPDAKVKGFEPSWRLTRKIASLSTDTSKIRDKNSYLHWLFSASEKEWIYIVNDDQLGVVKDELLPAALEKFKHFISLP